MGGDSFSGRGGPGRYRMPVPRPALRAAAASALVALSGYCVAAAMPSLDVSAVAARVVEATNRHRAAHGIPRVEANDALAAAAREFAAFMAKSDKFGHEADGRTPPERAGRHGYDYCFVSENLGYQFRSRGFRDPDELARGLVEGWKNSPGHRKNLDDRGATEIGVGVARGAATGRYYAVQMFGRPAKLGVAFAVVNESEAPLAYRVGATGYSLAPRTLRTHHECAAEPVSVEGTTHTPRNHEEIVWGAAPGAGVTIRPRGRH